MSESKRMFGVALFGAGRIGTMHFRNLFLNERTNVLWIIEEDLDRAKTLVTKYNFEGKTKILLTKDADKALNDPSVDSVMICTPSFTHDQIIARALQAGKAIFCEKPLAPTLEAMKAFYKEAATKNIPLFCAFNRRYDPQLRRIHTKVQAGEIGKVRMVRTISRDPTAMTPEYYLKSSGGIFIDSCVHDIDMVCWMVGEKPSSVVAFGHATNAVFSKYDDVDTVNIMLKFPGGAVANIEVSRYAQVGHDQRVEVFGNSGMLLSQNKRPTDVIMVNESGWLQDPIYDECCARYIDSYRQELDHYLDILEGKTKMEVTADSTVMVNTVALSARESLKTGQVVTLSW